MKYIFYIIPAIAGLTITTQAGVNSQLRFAVNSPLLAAFISFFTGTVILGLAVLVTRQPIPSLAQLSQIELYKFAGGLLGAFFVTGIILSIPKIGSANLFAIVIAGQMFFALLYDYFGMFGFPRSAITWERVAGVLLLVSGAYLINKK